jgi:hypothetical protein
LLKKFQQIRIVEQIQNWWHWWFLRYVDFDVYNRLSRFHDKIDSFVLHEIVCSSNDLRRNSFFWRLCNSLSRETWSYASITFMLNNVVILSLFIFQIVWICFVNNFKIVSQLQFLRSFIWLTKRRS